MTLMISRIASFLVSIAFSLSVFTGDNEAFSFHVDEQATVKADHSLGYTTVICSSDCEDCHDEGCGHGTEHCVHHCSALHNILLLNQKLAISNPSIEGEDALWDYQLLYTPPVLDPALKPPLFS